jgi:hypothetical protein
MSRTLHVAIVVYRSNGEWLLRTLHSLNRAIAVAQQQGRLDEAEIHVVDNAASEAATPAAHAALGTALAEAQQSLARGVRLSPLPMAANCGYGAANNAALARTRADYVLVLNPDVETAPDAISEAIAYLLAHADVAMVTPAATYPDGAPQYLVKGMPNVLALALRGFAPEPIRALFAGTLTRYEMRDVPFDAPLTGCRIVSGCWMVMRGDVWRASGGFDENFFLYFEDFDLSARIAQQHAIHRVPACRIVHAGGNAADKGGKHIGMFIRSAARFFSKHGWRWW